MPAFFPTVRRTLTDHLQRLTSNLDSLGHQVRAEIAGAVGQAVAEAVSEAVRGVLGSGPYRQAPSYRRPRLPEPPYPPRQRDYDPWAEPTDDPWAQEERDEAERYADQERSTSPSDRPSRQARLRSCLAALATGWQAGLWWLKRQRGKAPVLTTLAVGLAATLVALAAGPVAVAGVSALGAIVGLTALADGARSTADSVAEALSP